VSQYFELPRPTIFAHRGASAYAPENTLAAFQLAQRQGAPAIELDAKLTVDGKVVVYHDQTLTRTAGVDGRLIDWKYADLKKLDAGSHFDIAFRGEPIPLLEDVFEQVGRQVFINVELTNYASLNDDLPEKTAAVVRRHHLEDWVMFSSFSPLALARARRVLPQVPIGLLAEAGWRGGWARSWLGRWLRYQALHPEAADASPGLVQAAHRRNHRVHVYTVNQAEDMRRLFKLGVDGIFTDDPVLAIKLLAETV
jgi:glycerophosphoryl diester phosphodiesterase